MKIMDDKTILWDCLKDQKFLAGNYVNMSTEIACSQLLQDTMKICQDEIRSNFDIFNLMNQKGWYAVSPAQQQNIDQARSKGQQLQSSMTSSMS